jgi:hypothetical protein
MVADTTFQMTNAWYYTQNYEALQPDRLAKKQWICQWCMSVRFLREHSRPALEPASAKGAQIGTMVMSRGVVVMRDVKLLTKGGTH